uniref:Uncharacterized protein n=1 Tax=Solanum lycopersicum TaxID=4081 RepID=K4B5M1_SOLLC
MAPPKALKQTVAAVAQTAAPEASNPTIPSGIDVPKANFVAYEGSFIPPGVVVFDASRAAVCATAATSCLQPLEEIFWKYLRVPRIWMALSSF